LRVPKTERRTANTDHFETDRVEQTAGTSAPSVRLLRWNLPEMSDSRPIFVGRFDPMCRNIKTLFNFDPPVTEDEVRAASLQFVRKISGFTKPSKANEEAFSAAVEEIATISSRLLQSMETTAQPKNREEEAAKAKARAAERFGAHPA
jgi:hypothetical protein